MISGYIIVWFFVFALTILVIKNKGYKVGKSTFKLPLKGEDIVVQPKKTIIQVF